jgi:hypothetical protein
MKQIMSGDEHDLAVLATLTRIANALDRIAPLIPLQPKSPDQPAPPPYHYMAVPGVTGPFPSSLPPKNLTDK